MRNLLLPVIQHGGGDVSCKPTMKWGGRGGEGERGRGEEGEGGRGGGGRRGRGKGEGGRGKGGRGEGGKGKGGGGRGRKGEWGEKGGVGEGGMTWTLQLSIVKNLYNIRTTENVNFQD